LTDHYIRADPDLWEKAFAEHNAARAALDDGHEGTDPLVFNVIHEKAIAAEDKLLGIHAPHIDAVIEKLILIWGDDLFADTEVADQKQIIIGDLRRLSRD
jgi:hypothetical protein